MNCAQYKEDNWDGLKCQGKEGEGKPREQWLVGVRKASQNKLQ